MLVHEARATSHFTTHLLQTVKGMREQHVITIRTGRTGRDHIAVREEQTTADIDTPTGLG